MNEPADWPKAMVTLHKDGQAIIDIGGKTQTITSPTPDQARQEVIQAIAKTATQLGRPLKTTTTDQDGSIWNLIIHPNGKTEEDTTITPNSGNSTNNPISTDSVNSTNTANSSNGTNAGNSTNNTISADGGVSLVDSPYPTRRQMRQSFLTHEQVEEPARKGWRGAINRFGARLVPNEEEKLERQDIIAVSQHWPGPRTIAIVNGKGGAGKTPTTILLSAIFARYGGAGVLAWDNNQFRGTLGWRTEQGPHEKTLLELLPETNRLLSTGSQSADLAHFVHHQTRDKYDVLRSKPIELASAQRVNASDVDAIHQVASKYYRLIFIDSGNDESDPMWQRMIDHTDQLVVATTTRDDHAEAGALLLEALTNRDEKAALLAQNAVAIISQADPKAGINDLKRVQKGYETLAKDSITIPHDTAIVDGLLHYGALRADTQRAWLHAAAAVAKGL